MMAVRLVRGLICPVYLVYQQSTHASTFFRLVLTNTFHTHFRVKLTLFLLLLFFMVQMKQTGLFILQVVTAAIVAYALPLPGGSSQNFAINPSW